MFTGIKVPLGNMTKSKKDIFLWGMFYLVAQGGILLIPNAIYWDDWVFYRQDHDIIFDATRQLGSMFNLWGHLHVTMLKVGPWIYKVLTFILMFASGLLLNLILKRHSNITTETRFFVVLFFLVLPFNIARVALVDFPYTLCYFLFFLAWMLMDRYRVLALPLFFLSFNTNSLLVFYAVPFLDMLYRGGHLSSLKSALRFGIRRIDYILLPFVYFFIKVYLYPPSGIYEGYNQSYNVINLIFSPMFQMYDLFRLNISVGLCLFLSLFAFLLIKNRSLISIEKERTPWRLLALGLLVFLLGAFPYWILGYVPTFHEWTSRHQLLLPLGSALVIVGVLSINHLSDKMGVISIIIGASLAFNVETYATLFIDWQKQVQLMHLFANNTDIERAGLIVFEDKTESLNALERKYRFYEWNGILETTFGKDTRFGISRSEINDYLSGKLDRYFQGYYKAGLFRKDAALPPVLVEIDLVKSEGLRETIINSVFPKLTLSVSEIDLINSRKQ